MIINHVEDKTRQSKCLWFLCLIGSCCALNVFDLDRTKEVKPNLIARGRKLARKTTVLALIH